MKKIILRFMRTGEAKLWLRFVLLYFVLTGSSCLVACSSDDNNNDADNTPVIGIAWRADADNEFCTNAVRAIEAAGGKAVILDQVRYDEMTYGQDGKLLAEYVDEQGILKQQWADEIKELGGGATA